MSEEISSREQLLGIARKVAGLLVDHLSGVEGVGLFGSLARGEQHPEDIDMIVLTREATIPESFVEFAEDWRAKLYPFDWQSALPDLGAEWELVDQVTEILGGTPLDIVTMPAAPTDEYLRRFAAVNEDPDFLKNAAANFRRYGRESGKFTPTEAPWQDYLDGQELIRLSERHARNYFQAGPDAWMERQWEEERQRMREEMMKETPPPPRPEPPDATLTPP